MADPNPNTLSTQPPGQTAPGSLQAPKTSTPVNTPAAVTPQPAKEADGLASSKLQVLVAREKKALAAEASAKTYEQKIRAREESVAAREAKMVEFETLSKTNPLKALELIGLDYDGLTQVKLADGQIPAEIQVKKVEEKLNNFLTAQEQKALQEAEANKNLQLQREQEVTQEFKNEIATFINDNAKKFELTQFENQAQLVYDVIDEHYNRTMDPEKGVGKILTIEQACEKVEKYLRGKYEKAKELSSVKSLWAPQPVAKPVVKPQPNPYSQKPQTLTNSMSATPAPRSKVRTDEERIAAAIAYAKGLRGPQS